MFSDVKISFNLEGGITILGLLIAFFLPLSPKLVVLLIAFTGLLCLISWLVNGLQKPSTAFYPFAILFSAYGLGLLFTDNFDYGLKDIETRMTFFLFPLFYGITKRETPFPLTFLTLGLLLGCVVTTFFCYYYAGQCFETFGYSECYEGVRLAFSMHPTYLALYYIIALVFMWISFPFGKCSFFGKLLLGITSLGLLFMVYRFYSLGPCLLYTSDAADDLTRVDFGWCGSFTKKKNKQNP